MGTLRPQQFGGHTGAGNGGGGGGGVGFGSHITGAGGFDQTFTGARSPSPTNPNEITAQAVSTVRSLFIMAMEHALSWQFFFLFTSALLGLYASLWLAPEPDTSPPLIAYFAASCLVSGMVLIGVWAWDGFTYYYSEVIRATLAAIFVAECGDHLGVVKVIWREILFRACALALCAGVGGYILTLLPLDSTGEGWGLRALIGLHLGVAAMLSQVGTHEALSDFRQTAVRWLFVVAVADALSVATSETGPGLGSGPGLGWVKPFADWLSVIAWAGLNFFLTLSAFGASTKPSWPPARKL